MQKPSIENRKVKNPPISNRDLRIHIASVGFALLIGLLALIAMSENVQDGISEYPTTYLVLVLVFSCLVLGSFFIFLMVSRFNYLIVLIVSWLNETGLMVLVAFCLISFTLLLYQIENWLFPGSWLLSLSGALATSLVLIFIVRFYFLQNGLARIRITNCIALTANIRNNLVKDNLPLITVLFLIIISSAIVSGYYALYSPLMSDEAATYELFGRSWFTALTRYDWPNNHIFNSFLISLSTALFGNDEFAIRVPAYFAGILSLLATFGLSRKIFDRYVALLSIALVSSTTWVFFYSFQARGYPISIFLSVVAVWMFYSTLNNKDPNFNWKVFILCMSLAIGTLPTMLYLWPSIFLFGVGNYRMRRQFNVIIEKHWLKHFLSSMGIILAFTGLIYLNPLLFLFRTGRFFEGFSYSFQPHSAGELIYSFLQFTVGSIVGGNPSMVAASPLGSYLTGFLLLTGSIIAVISLINKHQLNTLYLFVCLLLIPLFITLVQRNLPFPRNFIYLVPFICILSAYGLKVVVEALISLYTNWTNFNQRSHQFVYIGLAGVIFLVNFSLNWFAVSKFLDLYHYKWPVLEIADYLENTARAEDGIIADFFLAYPVKYYISPEFHITSDIDWWLSRTPNVENIFIIPFMRESRINPNRRLAPFLARVCNGYNAPEILIQLGEQYIYQCIKP